MNLSFRDWLYNEIADIETRDASHVHLVPVEGGQKLIYNFSANGENYTVSMTKFTGTRYQIDNLYSITFMGPKDYNLTGTAGTTANVIYSQVLLAIKKLLESYPVNGLYFSPQQESMRIIYQRFFKQFLSKTFMQIDNSYYIKKDVLREYLNKFPNQKLSNLKALLFYKREANRLTREAKNTKKALRILQKLIPTFAYFYGYGYTKKLAYLYKLISGDGEPQIKAIIDDEMQPYTRTISANETDVKYKPSEQEIQKFIMKLSEINQGLEWFFKSEDSEPLKKLMAQHGIAPKNISEELRKRLFKISNIGYPVIITKIDEENSSVAVIEKFGNSDRFYLGNYWFDNLAFKEDPSFKESREFLLKLANSDTFKNLHSNEMKEKLIQLMNKHGINI